MALWPPAAIVLLLTTPMLRRCSGPSSAGALYGGMRTRRCSALLGLPRGRPAACVALEVGVDTPHGPSKPAEKIRLAYNDAAGITAAFTLNALRHVNRIASLDFDWAHGWRHVAVYDEEREAIVTHVEALGPQTVKEILG